MVIGVLAVQGAFIEHEKVLESLGVSHFEIRQKKDLEQPMDGLILPGGESTVMGKLLKDLELFEPLKKLIEGGLPVFGTCAGMILLAEELSNDEKRYFGTLPVTVRRNAYGRQLGSFHTRAQMRGIGEVPMTFIRAPYVEQAQGADVLATVDDNIVAVRYKNQLATAFHPELDEDKSVHKYFLTICEKNVNY